MVINLRALKKSARWTDKAVLVRIVYLPLVIITDNEFMIPPLSRLPIDVRADQPTLREKVINRARIEDRVWISSVAYRVSEQAADPQLFVRRPADVGNRSRVAVIIVRPRVVCVEAACAD